jgi:hypothetical protein
MVASFVTCHFEASENQLFQDMALPWSMQQLQKSQHEVNM